jgi:hypothetical protein
VVEEGNNNNQIIFSASDILQFFISSPPGILLDILYFGRAYTLKLPKVHFFASSSSPAISFGIPAGCGRITTTTTLHDEDDDDDHHHHHRNEPTLLFVGQDDARRILYSFFPEIGCFQ